MKKKILIVIADYYKDVSKGLLKNTYNFFGNSYLLKQIKVPGIFEIPVTISKNIKKYDGFIALGCVIKGETPHFDFISKISIESIMKLSVESKKPIGNGILTCMNISQALVRSDPNGKKRKGREAAEAVLSVLGFKT